MLEQYEAAQAWLETYPQLDTLITALALLLAAWLSNWIMKRILLRGIERALRATAFGSDNAILDAKIISRLSNIVPALVISIGVGFVPGLPESVVLVVRNVCSAFVVLTLTLAFSSGLNLVNTLYERRPDAKVRPVKGYIQVIQIVIYLLAVILIIAALIDRSPLILLSGLGAMAAVLILVFQDTLLSLVASVQISSNDIVRVGDWVEMPGLNADGDVIDIALHTIKIQNWDKIITTVPTKRFISDPFKNWRGMKDAGGRRIKRALLLDQTSVNFLSSEEVEKLYRFSLIASYLEEKEQEIKKWNLELKDSGKESVNTRRITNIGTFRAYVECYLRKHKMIRQDLTLIVRQLPITSDGLPLEVYCFTNTTAWAEYEGIQSDIFEHLVAILPEFGLRVFQHPSGNDMREMGRHVVSASTQLQEQLEADQESAESGP